MKAIKSFLALLLVLIIVETFILLPSSKPAQAVDNPVALSNSQLKNVHHIGIPVRNLDRSIKFYEVLTGGQLLFTNLIYGEGLSEGVNVLDARLRFAMLQIDNTILELIEYENPKGKDFDRRNNDVGSIHIAFQVPDIQAAYQRLKAQGMVFNAEPYTFTEKNNAPAVVGATFAYFQDPNGIQLELFETAHPKV